MARKQKILRPGDFNFSRIQIQKSFYTLPSGIVVVIPRKENYEGINKRL